MLILAYIIALLLVFVFSRLHWSMRTYSGPLQRKDDDFRRSLRALCYLTRRFQKVGQ